MFSRLISKLKTVMQSILRIKQNALHDWIFCVTGSIIIRKQVS